MITINTAFDEKMAENLVHFLKNKGIDSKQKNSEVIIQQYHITRQFLESFLEKSKKDGYTVTEISKTSFLISKMANIEKFGLVTCEICGFVTFEEELLAHRRTHGI